MTLDLQAACATAQTLAKQAGALLREALELPLTIDYKAATDMVTQFDRQSEALIVAGIRAAYPDHAIVGEEGGGTGQSTAPEPTAPEPFCWYIDPLDGTTNFTHRLPHFAVSIGLAGADGAPVVGVVYNPSRDECFSAIKGGGAWLNGKSIHVSAVDQIEQALLVGGFPYDKWSSADNNSEEWNSFLLRTQGLLCSGSAALDLSYVAAGRVEGFWEPRLHPWDVMAGMLIVTEAGGRVSNYRGLMDGVYEGQRIVASNGLIHERMLTIIMMGSLAPRPAKRP